MGIQTSSQTDQLQEIETAIIRFAGDSGDGIQTTGNQFTKTSAQMGNDVNTFPDFPAEIRAPSGTLAGVSGFQISFSKHMIHTHGDSIQTLVAMNPAALKVNLSDLDQGGLIIVNSDRFGKNDLRKAEFETNPLENGDLDHFRVISVPMSGLTLKAVEQLGMSRSQAEKCKNMFALGIVSWLYERDLQPMLDWIQNKFKPEFAEANIAAFQAGYTYALSSELSHVRYQIKSAPLKPGIYRQITGNHAIVLGLAAASVLAETPLVFSGYPITPASDILHGVSQLNDLGIVTFQAEDEIAAISASIGVAFGGRLAATATSGPGLALKSEALNLAIMTELPMVVIDVQRAGPSTGLPTKTEQSDLLIAMFGRHGDSHLPILSPVSPSDCFSTIIEAFHIAIKYMTPVIVLSDGYLANGASLWSPPNLEEFPNIKPSYETNPEVSPYSRNEETLARPWVIPGTLGLEHRIGGLEKDEHTGSISYDSINHERMTKLRAEKIARIANDIPLLEVYGKPEGDLLILGWGGTSGSIIAATQTLQEEGYSVSCASLRYLNPLPQNLTSVLNSFQKILMPEMNSGQLAFLLRGKIGADVISFPKVQGKPFFIHEIKERAIQILNH